MVPLLPSCVRGSGDSGTAQPTYWLLALRSAHVALANRRAEDPADNSVPGICTFVSIDSARPFQSVVPSPSHSNHGGPTWRARHGGAEGSPRLLPVLSGSTRYG